MTRSDAREIAVHMIFSLGFGTQSAEDVLESELNHERFTQLGEESALYSQYPNEKQEQYIRDLVKGVFAHGPELDDYIARYAVAGPLPASPAWRRPLCVPPCTRSCTMPGVPNAAAINAAVEMTEV